MVNDLHIQYFHQEKNKGSMFNFKFVLEKAIGEYFIWLNDNDERNKKFAGTLMKNTWNIEYVIVKLMNYSEKNVQQRIAFKLV